MNRETAVSLLLRVGIAFSFLYVAIQSFREPVSWIGFFPIWVQEMGRQTIGVEQMLVVFSIGEILIALWVLSGWRGFWSGLVSAALIGGIITTNLGAFAIVFRDVPIFFASLAYAFFSRGRN